LITPGFPEESADTRAGGLALFEKYKRNKNCALVELELDKDEYVGGFDETVGKNRLVEQKGEPDTAGDVGVYVLGNFSRLDGHLEKYSAEALAEMVKWLGFSEIRKLCLVACRAAEQPREKVNQGSFLEKFCRGLLPLQPMIAGWDSYVEVMAPSVKRSKTATEEFSEEEKTQRMGSKIASAGSTHKNDYVKSNEQARSHKKVIQWREGEIVPVLLNEGWSDK
jgi:hypothetical protein